MTSAMLMLMLVVVVVVVVVAVGVLLAIVVLVSRGTQAGKTIMLNPDPSMRFR